MPHTPGPWKGYGHTGYVYGPDVVVCRCGDYQDKELLPFNKERWAADVQLIAAAPTMLAALQEIERQYAHMMKEPPEYLHFTEEQLKFAREAWYGASLIARKALENAVTK